MSRHLDNQTARCGLKFDPIGWAMVDAGPAGIAKVFDIVDDVVVGEEVPLSHNTHNTTLDNSSGKIHH